MYASLTTAKSRRRSSAVTCSASFTRQKGKEASVNLMTHTSTQTHLVAQEVSYIRVGLANVLDDFLIDPGCYPLLHQGVVNHVPLEIPTEDVVPFGRDAVHQLLHQLLALFRTYLGSCRK